MAWQFVPRVAGIGDQSEQDVTTESASAKAETRFTRMAVIALICTGIVGSVLAFRQMYREAKQVSARSSPPHSVRVGDATMGDVPPALGTLPEFEFTSDTGAKLGKPDLLGKVWIADFVFTRCAGPCPLMTQKMSELQSTLESLPNVRFVSYSVDPDFDTPEVLARYGKKFGADPKRWSFLTGDRGEIYDLCLNGFKLAVDMDPDEKIENMILHSTKFVLVDQLCRIRGYYDGTDPASIAKLAEDVAKVARTEIP
jgi:protein SCO1